MRDLYFIVRLLFIISPHGLDAVVMDVQTEPDPSMVGLQRLLTPVYINTVVCFHVSLLVVYTRLNNTIPDGLKGYRVGRIGKKMYR